MSILATRGLKGKGFLGVTTRAWRGGLSTGEEGGDNEDLHDESNRGGPLKLPSLDGRGWGRVKKSSSIPNKPTVGANLVFAGFCGSRFSGTSLKPGRTQGPNLRGMGVRQSLIKEGEKLAGASPSPRPSHKGRGANGPSLTTIAGRYENTRFAPYGGWEFDNR